MYLWQGTQVHLCQCVSGRLCHPRRCWRVRGSPHHSPDLDQNTRLCYYPYIAQGMVTQAEKGLQRASRRLIPPLFFSDMTMYRSSCQKPSNCARKDQNDYDWYELQSSSRERRKFRANVYERLAQPPECCWTWQVCALQRCH